jgi:flagellar motor component MotA
MSTQTEFASKAFDQVYESFRTAAESALQMQQELFRQWTAAMPGFPKGQGPWTETGALFHKQWTKNLRELTSKYVEMWEKQYKDGLQALEEAFELPETKDPEELRQKVLELWQKNFNCLKELAQAQLRNFQAAIEQFMDLGKKPNP